MTDMRENTCFPPNFDCTLPINNAGQSVDLSRLCALHLMKQLQFWQSSMPVILNVCRKFSSFLHHIYWFLYSEQIFEDAFELKV